MSAKSHGKLKEMAEDRMHEPVTEALITVPACFNKAHREEAHMAAQHAGLYVLQLLSEPSAGGIAYGWGRRIEPLRTVIVFDLGGGTLDVSLLTVDKRIV
jgi:molecular chaperone DnaK (HSP70)